MKSEFGSRWHKDLGMTDECATENGNILIISENSLQTKKDKLCETSARMSRRDGIHC